MKTNIFRLFVVLAACSLASASLTITDDFSDGNYTVNPTWNNLGGTTVVQAPGEMKINAQGIMELTLPGSLDNTKSEISFDMWNAAAISATYYTNIRFMDYVVSPTWGLGYYVYIASGPTVYDGVSGVTGHDTTQAHVLATAGVHAAPGVGVYERWTFAFDPATGLTVKKDGVTILTQPNYWATLKKITSIRINPYTCCLQQKIIDNVVATYNIPEPATMLLLSTGFLFVKFRKRA